MEKGITKHVNIMFTFDSDGRVIDGTKENERDSRFLGVTFFDESGNKSTLDGKVPVIPVPYSKMNDLQKEAFDKIIGDYITLKDMV